MSFLTLSAASKQYQLGETTVIALNNVDLTIEKGEFTVIWGASGSGKSTLLNMLAMIDHPDNGQYHFNGQSLASMSDEQITSLRQNNIGIIFQSFNLVPVLTALENVMLPGQLHGGTIDPDLKQRAIQLMTEVGVQDYAHHLPDQLSGGQRQRVALARSLINQPELVIADEPTANLDSINSDHIIELFARMNEKLNTTFVFSTHDEKLIQAARRKVHLLDGCIIADTSSAGSSSADIEPPQLSSQAITQQAIEQASQQASQQTMESA